MIPALTPPTLDQFQRYGVNATGIKDVIWQPQYDHISYPAAGINELLFFQSQKGTGVTSAPGGTGSKTYNDTNMELAAQLPQPQVFLALALSFRVYPGINPGRSALAAAAIPNFMNDVWQLFRSAYVEFSVGEKVYIREAPMGKFPSQIKLGGGVALSDTTTAGAAQGSALDQTHFAGPIYRISPTGIPWGQNFVVKVAWPGLVALPSGQPARVGCDLHGWLARAVQ